ncbi:MAG: HpcH/HpaI aldolase family protein [Clostridia bacterium]
MRNRVKAKILNGEPTVGNWINLPSPSIVEIMAEIGMDWLVLDTEHGSYGEEILESMIRAMKGTDVVPIVRVADTNPALIKKALDRGAYGVICPLVNTAEQARVAVSACRYPPEGMRGVAGTRASAYGKDLGEYFETWNEEVLVICQIETAEALENVREIAAVDGIDVLFIGPFDLSANLGVFGQIDSDPVTEAIAEIRSAAQEAGVAVGYYAQDVEEVLQSFAEDMKFVAIGSEVRFLQAAAEEAYRRIADGL